MPGARSRPFRGGDKSELLAHYILEHIAFIARVPHEEDVGIDLFCSLYKHWVPIENIIEAGPSFSVQIKSNDKAIMAHRGSEWVEFSG